MTARLHLTISPGEDAPIYRQIVRQIREAVAGGRLQPGDRLPSHRELSQTLVIAPLTVKKAYDELERAGVVRTARGQGTFVDDGGPPAGDAERLEALRPAARRLVHEAYLAGVDAAELSELVAEEQTRLAEEQRRRKDRA